MTIQNPGGAFGVTELQQMLYYNSAPFVASAAVSAKRVVTLSTTGKVSTNLTNSTVTNRLVVGIARDAIAANASGVVILEGIAEDVPCDGAVARGDMIVPSGTTAGSVSASATPSKGECIGIAINLSASNVVDVWVSRAVVASATT